MGGLVAGADIEILFIIVGKSSQAAVQRHQIGACTRTEIVDAIFGAVFVHFQCFLPVVMGKGDGQMITAVSCEGFQCQSNGAILEFRSHRHLIGIVPHSLQLHHVLLRYALGCIRSTLHVGRPREAAVQ